MPESRHKKDLGGLARSIDSLFSGAPVAPAVDDEAEAVPEPLPPPLPEPLPPPLPEPLPPPLPEPLPLPAEAEPSTPPPPPIAAPPTPEAVPLPYSDADRREPGALELAVASYLAGGADAIKIRKLAGHHTEAREFEPVAVAVERLVLGAGEPPRADVLELARALMNPIVRGRVVKRLGQERDEARRADYHRMCRTLGVDMAEAIRDEMADEADRSARRAYFDALVAMREVSRPVVEAMAEDENVFLARNGVAILGAMGGPRAAELTLAALANPDARVRREALHSMALLQVEDADQLVIGLLEDSDEKVRLAAVTTAGELKIERAVRHLAARVDGELDPDVILPAMHALGRIGDPGAVPAIEKHAVRERFGKPRTEVRIAAYRALAQIGTPHARRLLDKALNDKDPAVKAVAQELRVR